MKLSILYCRDENGGVRGWEIEVEGSKFRTISGLQNGQKVTSEFTECLGKNIGKKNETSPEKQALLEAKSKHKKKKESGYFENIEDIDKQAFYQPILAHKYEDHSDKLPENIWVSPKMDGLRIIINKDGIFSRSGKAFPALSFIREELDYLFKVIPNLILDAEAYSHSLKQDFDKIVSLVKKTKHISDEDIKEAKDNGIKAYVFDMPCGDIINEKYPLKDRYFHLKQILSDKSLKYLEVLEYIKTTKSQIHEIEEIYIANGYEGLMARCPDSPYENKRSYKLLKLKRFQDEEFEIVDIIEGEGNRAGMFGKAVLKTKEGKLFEANSRGNEEKYRQMLKDKVKLKGQKATVRFQNYTPDLVPRFGVMITIRDYE